MFYGPLPITPIQRTHSIPVSRPEPSRKQNTLLKQAVRSSVGNPLSKVRISWLTQAYKSVRDTRTRSYSATLRLANARLQSCHPLGTWFDRPKTVGFRLRSMQSASSENRELLLPLLWLCLLRRSTTVDRWSGSRLFGCCFPLCGSGSRISCLGLV